MHEYSIVDALLKQVDREAQRAGATSVHRIEVRIGDLAGVERDLLALAFETFREGTVCAQAQLEIHAVAPKWSCPACGTTRGETGPRRCVACDSPLTLTEGDEIILERLELEVADVS